MPFPDSVVEKAWKNAKGHCECTRKTHGHAGKCNKQLVWENRGTEGKGAWQAHHKVSVASGGDDTLSNCEILCFDCHTQTGTYGG